MMKKKNGMGILFITIVMVVVTSILPESSLASRSIYEGLSNAMLKDSNYKKLSCGGQYDDCNFANWCCDYCYCNQFGTWKCYCADSMS
ncbi:unnamed protein product [Amaranthus hypochondriacus]